MKKRKATKLNNLLVFWSLLFLSFSCIGNSYAQNQNQQLQLIDVLHYTFEIAVNDQNDEIKGVATLQIAFKTSLKNFELDLSNVKDGKGMLIDEVMENEKSIKFTHQNDKIQLFIATTNVGEQRSYRIKYQGIPDDGLIISKNKFGDRVFFGDNWPNRAHHWLPTVDHPSDKATFEFVVIAPAHYQVVSNGLNIEETNQGEEIVSHWKTNLPLSTKLMVIGIARFAKQNLVESKNPAVSTWVYPQNKAEGFLDYYIALEPLAYFSEKIAPFPFEKLANVQSKTVFGGMENAGCIFYAENSVSGHQKAENLIAHEIAHQWFGDAVSELEWHHIWLSEGFATYLTGLYIENKYGKIVFSDWLLNQKNRIFRFETRKLAPVIDTTQSVSIGLLNANSYQKGAWFLHMLRKELGDDLFWKSIRTFYADFKYKNALTSDFQNIVEDLSGKNLALFFRQWLYESGHPTLSSEWKFDGKTIYFKLRQKEKAFQFPLDLKLIYEDGSISSESIRVSKAEEIFEFGSSKKPKKIILDPDNWLLFEVVI